MLGKVLMVLIVLVVATAGVVSWLGVAQVPVLSAAFGMDHPRDLHMVRDPAALNAFTSKWGIELPSPTQNYTLASKHHYSGSVQIDDTISEGALAALPEYSAPNPRVSQMQFRIHEGSIEMSAFVKVPGYPAWVPCTPSSRYRRPVRPRSRSTSRTSTLGGSACPVTSSTL
jgi:hypothetical protein